MVRATRERNLRARVMSKSADDHGLLVPQACETDSVNALMAGLATGLSLLIAIGAQNAYLLRLGLTRQHVGIAVTICATSDVVLILLGIGVIGQVTRTHLGVLEVLRWIGVTYLIGYAIVSLSRAARRTALLAPEVGPGSPRTVATATLAFTLLNPHVYIDTVLLLGSIGSQYGADRWLFALGASTGSIIWFLTLGYGAKAIAPLMSRPITWRVLDLLIGIVMLVVAFDISRAHLTAR